MFNLYQLGLSYQLGLTLLELMFAVLIIGVLTVIAVPIYQTNVSLVEGQSAAGCLKKIEAVIDSYYTEKGRWPDSLDEVTLPGDCRTDPWGNPFRYLKIAGKKGTGGNRKDRSENPLNSDYDLYSMGPDGKTNQSLRAKVSHDDIIRARNGAYTGLAADY